MRIAIVNDRPLAVEALRRAIALQPGHKVVWLAANGAEAVEQCARLTPDLILMDLIMPVMDGVEATKRIMGRTPCAILIVTASIGSNATRVFEAMGHGAVDAVETPALGSGDPRAAAATLLAKIDLIEEITSTNSASPFPPAARRKARIKTGTPLVAIGASAGGPAALAEIVGGLPRDFKAAVVIVQHIDRQFASGLVEWLGRSSALPVRLVKEGDRPEPGVVWVAGTNDHLCLQSAHQFAYTPDPRTYIYRPSVDVFFQSVMQFWSGPVVGVLLTGMGRDGALGLKTLRNQGHHTIAQDAQSCAVYGMPKAAVSLDAATEVLALARIAPRLLRIFSPEYK